MKLEIDLTNFYSAGDESRFFRAIEEIGGVSKIQGHGQRVCLTLNLNKLDKAGFFELAGLLRRYSIPLKPLAKLAEKEKFKWISEPRWYWAAEIQRSVEKA